MNFDVNFCNICSGKMIKVAFVVKTHDKYFIANFFAESEGERILKIGKHLAKL